MAYRHGAITFYYEQYFHRIIFITCFESKIFYNTKYLKIKFSLKMGFNRSKYCLIWFISVRQSAREKN